MNPAIPYPGAAPGIRWQRLSQPRLIPAALLQIAVIVAPSMAALGLGMFSISGRWFIATLAVFVLYHLVQREPLRAMAVVVGTIPVLAVYRGTFFPFSAPLALMAAVAGATLLETEQLQRVRNHALLIPLAVTITAYWWISIMISGEYSANMRSMEFALSAICLFLLSWRRSLLGTALVGIGITVIALGLGMLPHGDRLGMTDSLEEGRFGNPILLGMPAALTVMLTVVDGGRWLLLEKRPLLRNALGVLAGGLLVLSTSRGAWAIVIVGMALVFVFDRSSRKNIALAGALMVAAVAILLSTSRADIITRQVDKMLAPDRDFQQRTSGRSEQWIGFPDVFMAAPVLGHGPSRGRQVSAEYTHMNIPFHSLYLHVGAETGLLGLTILFAFLARAGLGTFRHRAETAEIGPMFGLAGFMVLGLSISALDMLSGLYVGLATIAGHCAGFWRYSSATVRVAHSK